MTPSFFGHNSTATGTPGGGGGGGGTASAFSDDFNRANSSSLGSNWTEVVGNMSISSNALLFVSGSFAANLAMWTTAVNSATQYMMFTISSGSGTPYPSMILRATSNTGAAYSIVFQANENTVQWMRYSNIATGTGEQSVSSAASVTGGIGVGDTFGVTVDGTGSNTVVRVWRNPTGLPVSASNWNGDTTPNVTFTSNPVTPADTGLLLGVYCTMDNSNGLAIDNWFGGSL